MNEQTEVLVKYRFEKAEETLESAQILLREKKLFSCVNRIYYACFYAVSGLLLTKGLSSSKHGGVLTMFNQEFVNQGVVDKDSGRFFNRMFQYRQKGDYQDFVEFDMADVEKWIVEAETFITDLKKLSN